MKTNRKRQTEIIVISSGKGGTGKTMIAGCLGYALTRAGHDVLMIDADPGTDGLSLFLLGPQGMHQFDSFHSESTFSEILKTYPGKGPVHFNPHPIHRKDDHGVSYWTLISSRGLYGDLEITDEHPVVPRLLREQFRNVVGELFSNLRKQKKYDYVIVDTRGGFAFESTDLCALADSFIVVTEADYTSLHQDRSLMRHINSAADVVKRTPLLRAIIVNKATENEEDAFRTTLTREFPISFEHTHPIPLDLEAIKAYKTQQMPYVVAPASQFSYASLRAFASILRVVTSRWDKMQIEAWSKLVSEVSSAVEAENERQEQHERDREQVEEQLRNSKSKLPQLEKENERLLHELERAEQTRAQDQERADEQRRAMQKIIAGMQDVRARLTDPKNRRADWQRTLRTPQALAAVAAVFTGIFWLTHYYTFAAAAVERHLENAYATSRPPALRVEDLMWLHRNGHRSFNDIVFPKLDLSGRDFAAADFKNANLPNSNLVGAKLGGADFTGANLKEAKFRNADLTGAILDEADLAGADLSRAILENANMAVAIVRDAILSKANLRGADLSGVIFYNSDLTGADLSDANVSGTDFSGTELTDIVLNVGTVYSLLEKDPKGLDDFGHFPLLAAAIESADLDVESAARRIVSSQLPLLVMELVEPVTKYRGRIPYDLLRLFPDEAAPLLISVLEWGNAKAQISAIFALGELGTPARGSDVVQFLLHVLYNKDKDLDLRSAAEVTLLKLGIPINELNKSRMPSTRQP